MTRATAATLPALSEREFLAQVIELAELLGWATAHFRPALTSRGWRTPVQGSMGKGFPDLVLLRVRDRRLIFAELKAEVGKLSADQAAVMAAFGAVAGAWIDSPIREDARAMSIGVHVWRPRDWPEIEAVLR